MTITNFTNTKFTLLYLTLFLTFAVINIFFPLYLDSLNYDDFQIGLIFSIGPLIALISQPVWGNISDRAKTKNRILSQIIIISSLILFLFRLNTSFIYILIIMTVFSFFQMPIIPLTDALTIEYMLKNKGNYGTVRFAGTLGYAVMAVIGAKIAESYGMDKIFIMAAIFGIFSFSLSMTIPKVPGHMKKNSKIKISQFLKIKHIIPFLILAFAVNLTISYYGYFFPIYYIELGGTPFYLGLAIFLASISEVFFLLFGDKILKKYDIKKIIFIAGLSSVIRWIFMYIVTDLTLMIIIQFFHGITFIVIIYSMSMYISQNTPDEIKSSSQSTFIVLTMTTSRIISSFLGGYFGNIVGIQNMFLVCAVICVPACIIFYFSCFSTKKVKVQPTNTI